MADWVVDNNEKRYISRFDVNRPPRPRQARAPLLIEGGAQSIIGTYWFDGGRIGNFAGEHSSPLRLRPPLGKGGFGGFRTLPDFDSRA